MTRWTGVYLVQPPLSALFTGTGLAEQMPEPRRVYAQQFAVMVPISREIFLDPLAAWPLLKAEVQRVMGRNGVEPAPRSPEPEWTFRAERWRTELAPDRDWWERAADWITRRPKRTVTWSEPCDPLEGDVIMARCVLWAIPKGALEQ